MDFRNLKLPTDAASSPGNSATAGLVLEPCPQGVCTGHRDLPSPYGLSEDLGGGTEEQRLAWSKEGRLDLGHGVVLELI